MRIKIKKEKKKSGLFVVMKGFPEKVVKKKKKFNLCSMKVILCDVLNLNHGP